MLTRRPVLDFGARAYVDIPYLALVLGALLVETRRPRAGAPVLALLAVAGLLRPEAWLFSVAYLAWLWRAPRARDPRLIALAVAAPLLWALADLAVTGDPLHSLLGTRDNAQTLERVTGLGDVPLTAPRRLGEILREPVLVGAAGGGVLALAVAARPRARSAPRPASSRSSAFCVLAAAGLPILGPLPAAARRDPRDLLRRRRVRLGAPAARRPRAAARGRGSASRRSCCSSCSRPRRSTACSALRHALRARRHPGRPRRARARAARRDPRRCAPVDVPNHRPVPLLALCLDVRPRASSRPRSGDRARGT